MKYKMLWVVPVMVLSVGISLKATAQAERKISLAEAIELSVKHSRQLKASDAKIEAATAALQEAVERRLPDAGVSGSYLRLNKPGVTINPKLNNTGNGAAPVAPGSAVEPSSAFYGLANVSLPLYAGSRIKYGIEAAKYLQQATKLDAENERDAVIMNTVNAYNNLYKSRAAVDLVTESLAGARQRVKDFSNLERNGIMARNDLLKAELQASNTELTLLDAENNWKLANINMNLMLGIPDTTVLTINEAELLQMPATSATADEYVQLAIQNRKDISALTFRKKAANTGIKSAKAEKMPTLAVTGGYVAADIPGVLSITNAVNIGLGVQYNLSSLWKNNSKVEQAKAREKELLANEELLSDAVRLQVNQAYQNFLVSRKKIEVFETAVKQAEENFKIVRNKFNNALATTTDLLDADVAQLQAKMNVAFARADASVAYKNLLQTTGQIQIIQNK